MTPFIVRRMPGALRRRLEGSPRLRRVVANFGWLFGDRMIRLGVGMIVSVWVARYMGPERFGIFSYVQAVIAVFLGLSTLGLDYVVVRELVKDVREKTRILGTTLALRFIGAMLAVMASNLVVFLFKPGNHLFHLLAAIMGSAAIFQAFDTIDLWFQSQVQSKYTVIVKNSAFGLMACVKVGLVLAKAPLVAFAWAVLAEAGLGALLLIVAYRHKREALSAWRVDRLLARSCSVSSAPTGQWGSTPRPLG